MLSTANGRFAAIALTSIKGFTALRSAKTKTTRSRTPITIEAMVRASPQPQTVDCWIPRTDRAIPATIRIAPRTSIRVRCLKSLSCAK